MSSVFVDSDSEADSKFRSKYKEIASTPKTSEHNVWRDEDSPGAELAPSPIPFVCTQDGQQGDIDVVWNYYSPKSKKHKTESETPIRRKRRKLAITDFSPIPKFPARKRTLNEKLKRQEFLKSLEEELTLFNKNVQKLISSKAAEKVSEENMIPNKEEDIFENSLCENVLPDIPTSMKKNLCEQILQRESDSPIESDDSINEYLLRASQAIEENITEPKPPAPDSIKFAKKRESKLTKDISSSNLLCNDSFDNIISMMNENEIISTQSKKIHSSNVALPKMQHIDKKIKNENTATAFCAFKNISNNFNLSNDTTKNKFTRYNSMPVAQNNDNIQKASSATLTRHKTMPFPLSESPKKGDDNMSRQGCTQEEIRRKREAAREKLLAKKRGQQNIDCNINSNVANLCNNNNIPTLHCPNKRVCLNLNEAGARDYLLNSDNKIAFHTLDLKKCEMSKVNNSKENDIKKEIERKRLQALQKLQKKKWSGITR